MNKKRYETAVGVLSAIAQSELEQLESEVKRLQIALAFWLPNVPMEDPEIANRVADDANLLIGLDAPDVPSAEDLGWISLR